MDLEIKKELASNWFKMLQDSICESINKLEKKNAKFKSGKGLKDAVNR